MCRWIAVAALCSASLTAWAQSPSNLTSAPPGTRVLIEITESVSSKTAKHGDFFPLKLSKSLIVNDKVLIPAGAAGIGQVVDAAPSGFMGKPAKLVLAARYLELDGKRIPLRSLELGLAGQDNSITVAAVSAIPYIGIGSLLIKGGEIEAPVGTTATAKLSAEFPAAADASGMGPAPDPVANQKGVQ